MRAFGLCAVVVLFAIAACGRSPLRQHGYAHGGSTLPGDHTGSGGSVSVASGAGGATRTATAAAGSGGGFSTGGARASGGSGTGGRIGAGGAATGGGVGTGGRTATGVGGAGGAGGLGHDGGASGGASAAGGAVGTGGTRGTSGISPTGGSPGSGGRSGFDGAATGGSTARGGTGGTAETCGDGTLGPGEQCDLGSGNEATPAFLVTQAGHSFVAVPLESYASGGAFYDYRSSSAHTGLEAIGASRILLFLDQDSLALSLLFFHGADQDSTGQEQPTSHVQMLFSGLPDTTAVEISDDSDELLMTSATTATGFWKFTNNSDGGSLTGLPFPGDWKLTVEPFFIDGISTWTWVAGDGSLVDLDLTQPLTIEARGSHGQCRPDCTVPQCGDGILDGGEICDDGRPSKSGCSTNCMSFN
jgi:cysteine-rich repeat protein